MDLETKPIQRDSLLDLLDASRAQPARQQHAHTVRRTQRMVRRERQREPSALRGLLIVVLLVLGVRWLVLAIF
jgi:hypothetical protein